MLIAIVLLSHQCGADPDMIEIEIARTTRMANVGPNCAYCCLEMAARHSNIKSFDGLTKAKSDAQAAAIKTDKNYRFEGVVIPNGLVPDVKLRKVKYFGSIEGKESDITDTLKLGRPSIVTVRNYPATGDVHCVLITGYGVDVKFIDPNFPDEDRLASQAWFKDKWTHGILTIWTDGGTTILTDKGATDNGQKVRHRFETNQSHSGFVFVPNLSWVRQRPADPRSRIQGGDGRPIR